MKSPTFLAHRKAEELLAWRGVRRCRRRRSCPLTPGSRETVGRIFLKLCMNILCQNTRTPFFQIFKIFIFQFLVNFLKFR